MPYLALWKVADADFPTAPNPTPTAKPSEMGRRKKHHGQILQQPRGRPSSCPQAESKAAQAGEQSPGSAHHPSHFNPSPLQIHPIAVWAMRVDLHHAKGVPQTPAR